MVSMEQIKFPKSENCSCKSNNGPGGTCPRTLAVLQPWGGKRGISQTSSNIYCLVALLHHQLSSRQTWGQPHQAQDKKKGLDCFSEVQSCLFVSRFVAQIDRWHISSHANTSDLWKPAQTARSLEGQTMTLANASMPPGPLHSWRQARPTRITLGVSSGVGGDLPSLPLPGSLEPSQTWGDLEGRRLTVGWAWLSRIELGLDSTSFF